MIETSPLICQNLQQGQAPFRSILHPNGLFPRLFAKAAPAVRVSSLAAGWRPPAPAQFSCGRKGEFRRYCGIV